VACSCPLIRGSSRRMKGNNFSFWPRSSVHVRKLFPAAPESRFQWVTLRNIVFMSSTTSLYIIHSVYGVGLNKAGGDMSAPRHGNNPTLTWRCLTRRLTIYALNRPALCLSLFRHSGRKTQHEFQLNHSVWIYRVFHEEKSQYSRRS
jgi:hypothetical protein